MKGRSLTDPAGSAPWRDLLRELRETARQAADVSEADREALLSRRQVLRRKLATLPFLEALTDPLREHLSHVRDRLERLESSFVAPGPASREILELRGDLVWLPLSLPERALDQAVASLTAEISSLDPLAKKLEPIDSARTLAAVRAAEGHLTRILLSRTLDRAKAILDDPAASLSDLSEVYLEAEDLSLEGHDTRAIRRALRARIAEVGERVAPEEAAQVLSHFAEEAEGRTLDMLAAQAGLPPRQAARSLDRGRRELVWMRRLFRDVIRVDWGGSEEERRADDEMRKWRHRLTRLNRRMTRESQEIRLTARLEELFGHRFTEFFDRLILWLIFVVLGVLVLQAFLPLPHLDPGASARALRTAARWAAVHELLLWADGAICGVFLLEFFGKLALVRGKLSWFLRHFLVDLLPSIPYGLVATRAMGGAGTSGVARLTEVPRLIRFLRVARPIIRLVRVFGFLQRGLDRVVRLHGSLLNRNVVLFEPEADPSYVSPTSGGRPTFGEEALSSIRARIREASALARRTWRRLLEENPPLDRADEIRSFLERLPGPDDLATLPAHTKPGAEVAKVLRAEELVERLTTLDADTVEAELGLSAARRFAATLDRIDVPVVRLFPGLGQMVRAARGGDPLARVARAGRALGRWLGRLLGLVTWLADLSGIITGPQFLDRLGSAMEKATARPARRLLIFGLGFLVLNGVVDLVWDVPKFQKDIDGFTYLLHEDEHHWLVDDGGHRVRYDPPMLVELTEWLRRVLGTPFLVLGGGCLVILLTGNWFRRIAGEASDFYTRTAEAQYINLLKSAKLTTLEDDLSILWERALRPENLLRSEPIGAGPARLLARFKGELLPDEGAQARPVAPGDLLALFTERVLHLYHDYLDGALFHSSDTKTTGQLLGNLALENIRSERLRTSRKERRRLGALDLDRERSFFRGPYLWFHSVNHSVAQWTAKLILEYNRRAIPLAERSEYPPAKTAACDAWLDGKIKGKSAEPEEPAPDEEAFVTTDFTALHFLTADPDRDAEVRARFGERILTAIQADRRAMIRTVFGTWPLSQLPRADRTLNPFDLYGRYLAGGRAVLLPFYLLKLCAWGTWWLLLRVRETLREILTPSRVARDTRENWAPFEVALRKINRMRKPLFMECARFRATFDPEYLGLDLVPEEESGVEGRTFKEDLESIGARDQERDFFDKLRASRSTALRELASIAEGDGRIAALLGSLHGGFPAVSFAEARRAVAIAWAIDYRNVRNLWRLERRTAAIVAEVIRREGHVARTGIFSRFFRLFLPAKGLRKTFRGFLARFAPPDLTDRQKRWLWRAVRAGHRGLDRLVGLTAALDPGTTPEAASVEILKGVAMHAESWSEQLVTLRAVQSLSVLDIRNYRRQVRELGGYDLPERKRPGSIKRSAGQKKPGKKVIGSAASS